MNQIYQAAKRVSVGLLVLFLLCAAVSLEGLADDSRTVRSIAISKQPDKRNYEQGEALDTTGLELKVTYTDGGSETLTSGFEVSGYDPERLGTQILTVTYRGFSTVFTVKVTEPSIPPELRVDQPMVSIDLDTGGKTVTLRCGTPGATIYYTLDGTIPKLIEENRYQGPIRLEHSVTLCAIAVNEKGGQSTPLIDTIKVEQVAPLTAAPDPAAGSIPANSIVTLRSDTPGVTIFYTTDGSKPTTDSNVYQGGILMDTGKTIRAFAVKDGSLPSEEYYGEFQVTAAQGAGTVAVSLAQVTAHAGDAVSISVTISTEGGSAIGAFELAIQYNRMQFETGIQVQPLNGNQVSYTPGTDRITIHCEDFSSPEGIASGEVCEIIFTPLASQEGALCNLTVDVPNSWVRLRSDPLTPQTIQAQDGYISVEKARIARFLPPQLSWKVGGSEATSLGQLEDQAGAQLEIKGELEDQTAAADFSTGKVILALYAKSGMMVKVQSQEFSLENLSFFSVLNLDIPAQLHIAKVKVMVVSEDMVPLAIASEFQ